MSRRKVYMTSPEYREHLEALGIGNTEASRLLGKNPRTCRRWAHDRPITDATVAIVLRLMRMLRMKPEDIKKLHTKA